MRAALERESEKLPPATNTPPVDVVTLELPRWMYPVLAMLAVTVREYTLYAVVDTCALPDAGQEADPDT